MADVHEDILRRQLEKIAKEHEYDDHETNITAISSEGANYTSKLFLATLSAPNKQDLNLFAKVAIVGEAFRKQMHIQIFDIEKFAYNTLRKFYDKIQDKYEVPDEHRHKMPKFYAFDDTLFEETLVLENLSARGYTTYNRLEAIDWEYASRCLEELAKFHALSIVFQEDYPEEYEKATEVLQVNIDESEKTAAAVEQVAANTVAAITNEDHRERLRKFLEDYNKDENFMKSFYGPQKRAVLAHGDFRMSNIMHKLTEDGLDVIILDYQCIHVGCGIRDVLFFLLSGTDEEFRDKYFHPLLDHYYKHVCLMLQRLKREPEVVFPRADFDYEVEKNLPWGLILAMFVLPVVTVASENAPKVDDEFSIESMTSIKTSSLYETRINGVISDYVKWGVI